MRSRSFYFRSKKTDLYEQIDRAKRELKILEEREKLSTPTQIVIEETGDGESGLSFRLLFELLSAEVDDSALERRRMIREAVRKGEIEYIGRREYFVTRRTWKRLGH